MFNITVDMCDFSIYWSSKCLNYRWTTVMFQWFLWPQMQFTLNFAKFLFRNRGSVNEIEKLNIAQVVLLDNVMI